jgi:hypothetical protein
MHTYYYDDAGSEMIIKIILFYFLKSMLAKYKYYNVYFSVYYTHIIMMTLAVK